MHLVLGFLLACCDVQEAFEDLGMKLEARRSDNSRTFTDNFGSQHSRTWATPSRSCSVRKQIPPWAMEGLAAWLPASWIPWPPCSLAERGIMGSSAGKHNIHLVRSLECDAQLFCSPSDCPVFGSCSSAPWPKVIAMLGVWHPLQLWHVQARHQAPGHQQPICCVYVFMYFKFLS